MFFFEKRRFNDILNLNRKSQFYSMTLLFIALLFTFPITVVTISIMLVSLFQYKLYTFLNSVNEEYEAEPGDILIFFSHTSVDIPEWVFWNGVLSLHTKVPMRHMATVLDDKYYVDSRHPDFPKYDNVTKGLTCGIPRLAKLKYIYEDWATGEIMVIKTGQSVDSKKREEILQQFNKKKYWEAGGCLGHFNSTYKTIDPTSPNFLSVEDILRHYQDARIGRLKV
jgi:hypothetical protein